MPVTNSPALSYYRLGQRVSVTATGVGVSGNTAQLYAIDGLNPDSALLASGTFDGSGNVTLTANVPAYSLGNPAVQFKVVDATTLNEDTSSVFTIRGNAAPPSRAFGFGF